MRRLTFLLLLLLPTLLFGQETRLFFVGNLAVGDSNTTSTLNHLQQQIQRAGEQDILVFLGNNYFSNDELYSPNTNPQLQLIRDFPGRSVVLSGYNDWGKGKKKGWERILDQESYFNQMVDTPAIFLPPSGCGDPVEILLNQELVLIVINTQFFLHSWNKPGEKYGCTSDNVEMALDNLAELVRKNSSKRIIVAGYHPILSYGRHRKGIGVQNLSNPRYAYFRKELNDIFESSDQLVYVSAHDDGLQYLTNGLNHQIVVGAGSDFGKLDSGDLSVFHAAVPGFAEIEFKGKRPTNLTLWDGLENKSVYQTQLYEPTVLYDPEELASRPVYNGTTMLLAADTSLASTGTTGERLFLGNVYRSEWSTFMEFPTFDLKTEHGGLEVKKVGGGGQTRTLRLEAANGRQYVLRSLKKWPVKAVPDIFKPTFAAQLATDQMSDAHPYGALVVPRLADAVKILHTNPTIVALPDDPLLGKYRNDFKGLLALYEERPNDEAAGEPHFGSGEEIKSTFDVLDKLRKNNNHRIDDKFLIRNRMFDMWMGDWDRHEDQWRWVETKNKKGGGNLYRPIPRDRDQVFFTTQGLLPWLVARKSVYPIFQGFHHEVKWADALNWQARWFDRSFLNQLEWKDWEKQIHYLQKHLTDEVIDSAFAIWPDTIYNMSGPEIKSKLQSRRANMEEYGREYYEFLAKEVDVIGSDEAEFFEVNRIDSKKTRVKVYKLSKKGKHKNVIYKRTFLTKETKEIRLYGLGGDDVFHIEGEARRGIKIRVIGGAGKDSIVDESIVYGLIKKTVVYDEKEDTKLTSGRETANRLSNDPGVNRYDRKAYKVDRTIPLISVNWNRDDGVFIGGGAMIIKQGFRKYPYKEKHRIAGNLAFATGAFKLQYKGDWTDVFGKWDVNADLLINRPYGVANFFGMGNESVFNTNKDDVPEGFSRPIDFYRMRYELFESEVNLKRNIGKRFDFFIGPRSGSYHIIHQDDRFIAQPGNGLDSTRTFGYYHYLGLGSRIELDTRDNAVLPTRGISGEVSFDGFGGLNDNSKPFARMHAELEYIFSVKLPAILSIANRVGYSASYGDYEFFNGAVLGRQYMRGLRRGRYYGDQLFFHNLDVRLKILSFTSIIVPGSFGVLGFHDVGRVWYEPETSYRWHNSYGGGVWLSPLNVITFTLTYAHTEDEDQVIIKTRFHF
ncbi:BamA/TamA family outer membrane protein [bacterium SCSIO 12741]|nr:BamA/TamA family outer membrane protein [bacterium SCSIO 12741]